MRNTVLLVGVWGLVVWPLAVEWRRRRWADRDVRSMERWSKR